MSFLFFLKDTTSESEEEDNEYQGQTTETVRCNLKKPKESSTRANNSEEGSTQDSGEFR